MTSAWSFAPRLSVAGAGAGKMRDLLSIAVAEAAGAWNFVLDPRGEISAVTMVNFAIPGAHAYCWNPTGLHDLPQHAMQPLDILKLESLSFHADCKFILQSLIPVSGSASGKYFELRAQEWGEAFSSATSMRSCGPSPSVAVLAFVPGPCFRMRGK